MDKPQLRFLGAAGTVTGSKFLVSYEDTRILLDCGLFQGLKDLRLRNWSSFPVKVAELNGVILTHAHIDHSGYLPKLVKLGFRGAVYATPATCDLLRILLPDSAHLQEEEAGYANRRGYSKHKPALPLYTVDDAEQALRLLRPLPFNQERELGAGMSFRFQRAGHILGAATVKIAFERAGTKRALVDSGDLGRYARPILKDPEAVDSADWLIVESTYGDRTHPENPEEELARVIQKVAGENGCLIIPSFAVGRAQELIYAIRSLEDQGKIPALPVHIDSPMAIDATEIYCDHPEEHDLDMQLLKDAQRCPLCSHKTIFHRTADESKRINDLRGPLIIISASGMVSGGRVLHHLKQRLPDPKTTVLFVGFQAEGTRGRTIQSGIKEVKMLGEIVPVKAAIQTIDGFSAHGDQGEILRWLRSFKRPPRRTYIVHGEAGANQALAAAVREQLKWKVEIPKYFETVVLD
jgi:metallo-beta-lactamase family protein